MDNTHLCLYLTISNVLPPRVQWRYQASAPRNERWKADVERSPRQPLKLGCCSKMREWSIPLWSVPMREHTYMQIVYLWFKIQINFFYWGSADSALHIQYHIPKNLQINLWFREEWRQTRAAGAYFYYYDYYSKLLHCFVLSDQNKIKNMFSNTQTPILIY